MRQSPLLLPQTSSQETPSSPRSSWHHCCPGQALAGPWSSSQTPTCVPHRDRASDRPRRRGAPHPPVVGDHSVLRERGAGAGGPGRRHKGALRQGIASPFQHPHPGSGAVGQGTMDTRLEEGEVQAEGPRIMDGGEESRSGF